MKVNAKFKCQNCQNENVFHHNVLMPNLMNFHCGKCGLLLGFVSTSEKRSLPYRIGHFIRKLFSRKEPWETK